MITDVIREAKSEHEIYFLLTAYLEAIHFSDKLKPQPELAGHPADRQHRESEGPVRAFHRRGSTGRRKNSITKPACGPQGGHV